MGRKIAENVRILSLNGSILISRCVFLSGYAVRVVTMGNPFTWYFLIRTTEQDLTFGRRGIVALRFPVFHFGRAVTDDGVMTDGSTNLADVSNDSTVYTVAFHDAPSD